MTRLKDKVSIITGAGQGIGRATARRFADEGAIVIVAEMNARPPIARSATFARQAPRPIVHRRSLDVCRGGSTGGIRYRQFGHLDVLVNNVGGATALKPYTSGIRTTSWQR